MPTLSRKRSRSRISFRILPAISRSRGRQRQVLEKRDHVGDGLRGHLVDGAPADPDRERLGLQAPALTRRARLRRHVGLELRPVFGVLALLVTALDHGNEPLEGRAPVVLALLGHVGELDLVLARAIEDDFLGRLRELSERLGQLELVVLREGCHLPRAPVRRAGLEDRDRTVLDRFRRVLHETLRVRLEVRAQARAGGARAVGGVEREQARRDFRERRAAVRTGVVRREDLLRPVGDGQDDQPPRDARRRLDRVREALAVLLVLAGLGDEAVDDDLDRVLLLFVELRRIVEVDELPVDAGAQEALLDHLGHLLLVFALLPGHVGGEHHELRAGRQPQRPVDHLLDGLGLDGPAAFRAVGLPDRGVEQPEIVVDLGHRADGRPGIPRRRPLLDRNGRREALDRVEVRLLHLFQELPGVGREGLHVAPLALGEDRVERERGLPRAGHAGDDDELVARQVQRNVLEIVLPRSANPNGVHEEG